MTFLVICSDDDCKLTSEAQEVSSYINWEWDLFPVGSCTFFLFFHFKCIT